MPPEATAEQAWEDYIASVDTDRETIEAAGVTVTQMTEAERAKMIGRSSPPEDELLAANDWAPALIERSRPFSNQLSPKTVPLRGAVS